MATWNVPPTFSTDFVDEEFILDVCGIRTMPQTTPPILPNPSNGSIQVQLDEEGKKHIFRHAKEVQKGSRGGYLKGKSIKTFDLTLSKKNTARVFVLGKPFEPSIM